MEEKKSGIKKFFEEFKAFAMRGNVLDMAVGVVIGGAFTAIVTALVEDIINPLIGLFFKADFSDVVIGLGGSSIKIGEFVNSIINFLIVAFVLFVVIKFVNSLHKKPEAPAEPDLPDGPFNNWSEVLEALQTFDIPLYGILANSNAEIKNGRVIINSDNPTLFDFICTDTHSKELARAVYKVIGKRMKIAVANKEKPKTQAASPLEELKKKINDFNNGG